MLTLFKEVFFIPLYNALVLLIGVMPAHEIGLAIIVMTVAVKLALFPLQTKATKTQIRLRVIDGEIKAVREKHKTDRVKQAEALMALYRREGISPFSGVLPLLIQIPVILALFYVFKGGFDFRPDLLYSFVGIPAVTDTFFLGLELTKRSVLLAILTGVTQFAQMAIVLPPLKPKLSPGQRSFGDDLARSMHLQMKYATPLIIGFLALGFPAALALYWTTSNILSTAQGWYLKRHESFPRVAN